MRREKDKEEEERKRKEDKEEVKEVKEIEEREKESKNIDSCKIRPALQPEGRMQSSSQPVIQPIGIVQSSGQVAGSAETNEKIYSVVRKARKTVGFSPITSNNIKKRVCTDVIQARHCSFAQHLGGLYINQGRKYNFLVFIVTAFDYLDS